MEKEKVKKDKGARNLSLVVPFEFVSVLSFEECVARLPKISERMAHAYRINVDVTPTIVDVYGGQNCRFLVMTRHGEVRAAGQLRSYPEETATHVMGQVGFRKRDYISSAVIFVLLALLCGANFYLSRNILPFSCCFAIILIASSVVLGIKELQARYILARTIRDTLEPRFPYD